MERKFQIYVAGSCISPGSLYHSMGKHAAPLGDLLAERERRRVQVYWDDGQGFREERSYFIDTGGSNDLRYTVTIPAGAVGMTVDPALSACLLKDLSMAWIGEGGEEIAPVRYKTNGYRAGRNSFLFDNSDPKIIIEEMMQQSRSIKVSYRINILEEETVDLLLGEMGTKGRDKKKIRRLIKG